MARPVVTCSVTVLGHNLKQRRLTAILAVSNTMIDAQRAATVGPVFAVDDAIENGLNASGIRALASVLRTHWTKETSADADHWSLQNRR
jgi:hypothetical protein